MMARTPDFALRIWYWLVAPRYVVVAYDRNTGKPLGERVYYRFKANAVGACVHLNKMDIVRPRKNGKVRTFYWRVEELD